LQTNYAALFVLRCLQSSGSSGTVALGNAVVSDIATSSERGVYIGYASAGALLGPAIGPIIGGLLSHYLGWRAIFWFLTIFGGVVFVVLLIFFPETCRPVVGNGSIPAKGLNLSVLNYHHQRKQEKEGIQVPNQEQLAKTVRRRPSPIATVRIVFEKEAGLVLTYAGIMFAGYYMVVSGVPSQFAARYGFNSLQIGLCYIPTGAGSISAAFTQGYLVDWNFRRHARRIGYPIVKGRQRALGNFPIEKARIQIALPMIYLACAATLTYGWVMHSKPPLAAPLVVLFFIGYANSASFNIMSTLIVDLHPRDPGTATAANNLVRCLLGAGGTAVVIPLLNAIGSGWTYTLVAGVWFALSPILWLIIRRGPLWRVEGKAKDASLRGNTQAHANS